jgi:hypothetical protein
MWLGTLFFVIARLVPGEVSELDEATSKYLATEIVSLHSQQGLPRRSASSRLAMT